MNLALKKIDTKYNLKDYMSEIFLKGIKLEFLRMVIIFNFSKFVSIKN